MEASGQVSFGGDGHAETVARGAEGIVRGGSSDQGVGDLGVGMRLPETAIGFPRRGERDFDAG